MNILVIGNGFDLAHGLPTKYEDFLRFADAFVRLKEICIQKTVENDWNTVTSEDKDFILKFSNWYDKKDPVFAEIEFLTRDNAWLEYFVHVSKSNRLIGKDGWIDFESEISRIIQALETAQTSILDELSKGNENGKMQTPQYLVLLPLLKYAGFEQCSNSFCEDDTKKLKSKLLNDLNRLTRCLELYLLEYVENEMPNCRLPDIDTLDVQCVLSFNYTHTFNRLYNADESKKIRFDYIHGEVKTDSSVENCGIVLGIDEYLKGDSKNRNTEYIQFKKFYQRIFKKTGCQYVDWLSAVKNLPSNYGFRGAAIHNVFIVGHSLDVTDKDILYRLISLENTKTTILYHNQEALGRQISNLVKVIGEDELISRVHGTNASIVLQEQQAPVIIK